MHPRAVRRRGASALLERRVVLLREAAQVVDLALQLLLRREHAGTSARGGMPTKEGPKTVDHTTTASLTARGRRRSLRADKAKSARAAHDEG